MLQEINHCKNVGVTLESLLHHFVSFIIVTLLEIFDFPHVYRFVAVRKDEENTHWDKTLRFIKTVLIIILTIILNKKNVPLKKLLGNIWN